MKDGLAGNNLTGLCEDANGFIWISTTNGVSRFDGHSFQNFSSANGLPDNEVNGLFQDSKGRIWFKSYSGVPGYFDGKFHTSLTDSILGQLSLPSTIDDILEDNQGRIWLCSRGPVVKSLSMEMGVTQYKSVEGNGFEFDISGNIFCENLRGEICLFNEVLEVENKMIKTNSVTGVLEIVPFTPTDFSILQLNRIVSKGLFNLRLLNDERYSEILTEYGLLSSLYFGFIQSNTFWTYNQEGIISLFEKREKWQLTTSVPVQDAGVFLFRNDGSIWIGSEGKGLFFCPNPSVPTYFGNDPEPHMTALLLLPDSSILIGTANGKVHWMRGATSKTIAIRPQNYFRTDHVRQIHPGRRPNHFFIAHEGGISELTLPAMMLKLIVPVGANSIAFRNDTLYAGTRENTILLSDSERKSIFPKRTTALQLSESGKLYIGGTNFLSVNENGQWLDLAGQEVIQGTVSAIVEDRSGRLLIGTIGHGLYIFSGGQFKHFHIGNGLYSNTIRSLFVNEKDHVWIGTDHGLMWIEQWEEELKIHLITIADGLAGNDVYDCVIKDGIVYAATTGGLSIFKPSDLISEKTAPNVLLTAIKMNGMVQSENSSEFTYQENSLQFDFTGIAFHSLGEMNFNYRLLPLEKNWISTNQRTANYLSLPPGTYKFEVLAFNKDRVSSAKPVFYEFTIHPRTTDTMWFRSIVIAILFFIAIGGVLFRFRMIRKENNTKNKLLMLEQRALLTQMNPHFIYNSLSSIQQFIAKNDKRQASIYLARFSSLIRNILQHSKSPLIPLEDEIETLELYLELEKMRFSEQFEYQLIVEEELKENALMIPAMMVQPFVENAILHGLNPLWLEGIPGRVVIRFEDENEFLHCVIEDNGVGREKAEQIKSERMHQHTSTAIQNIADRLQLLETSSGEHGKIFYMDLKDNNGKPCGTKVDIYIPIV